MTKRFFIRLCKMERNTRKLINIGKAKRRVSVDREQDGTYTVVLTGGMVSHWTLAYDAAKYLRDFERMHDGDDEFFLYRRALRSGR